MKIVVKESGGKNIHLVFPSGLVFNWFTAGFLVKALEDTPVSLEPAQARHLIRVLNRYRKTHKGWVLVEVDSADGDKVHIKL